MPRRLNKRIPILRLTQQRKSKIQPARLQGRPPQRVSPPAALRHVAMHDWPMPRHHHVQRHIRFSAHRNHFVAYVGRQRLATGGILQRIRFRKLLNVKILHVRIAVRQTPRDPVVVPDDHQRRAGKRKSFHVQPRRSQMHDVPQRRHRKLQMRVVRQQRLARNR